MVSFTAFHAGGGFISQLEILLKKISHKAEFLTVLTVSSNVFIYTLE